MKRLLLAALVTVAAIDVAALKIEITPQDVDRALTLARGPDSERLRFHERYLQDIKTPFVERVEVVSEFRRVVLMAEERARNGDRQFGYSVSAAVEALGVFRRRVSVIARVRFHPLNNYVDVPPVTIGLRGNDGALIGVKRDPVLALPPGRTGEFVPILGAVVEASFEAEAIGQGIREFVVALQGQELAHATFDFSAID
jgi:hypothetical protein